MKAQGHRLKIMNSCTSRNTVSGQAHFKSSTLYVQDLNFTGSLFSTVGFSNSVSDVNRAKLIWGTNTFPASVSQSVLVAQTRLALCDPMGCSPPSSSVHEISQQDNYCGLPFPSPGDFPNPGIEPWSPDWQEDSLLLSHLGSP